VLADRQRIERPLLFVLGAEDRLIDPEVARVFAGNLAAPAQVRWYPDLPHDLLDAPQVRADVITFLAQYRP